MKACVTFSSSKYNTRFLRTLTEAGNKRADLAETRARVAGVECTKRTMKENAFGVTAAP